MLNRVELIGHLGRDPEIRSTQSGQRIANLNLATSERWTDKQSGERREKTEWHRVVVFNDRLVGLVDKYVSKGSMIRVQGKIRTRKWTDNAGVERYSTEIALENFDGEITLLSRNTGSGGSGSGDAYEEPEQRAPARAGASTERGDLDDEIPF